MAIKHQEFNKCLLSDTQIKKIVKQMIDLHVHGPDMIPRKLNPDAKQLADEIGNIQGLVLKSHLRQDMIELANTLTQDFKNKLQVFGSLTLNHGFDHKLIETAIKTAGNRPFIVWGPTLAAKAYLSQLKSEYAVPLDWIKGSSFKPIKKKVLNPVSCLNAKKELTKDTFSVLELLSSSSGLLASGHLSAEETYKLGIAARHFQVPFIATHVLLGDKSLLLEKELTELTIKGAWLEFCYIFIKDEDWDFKYNRLQIVKQIKKYLHHVIVTSDCGQVRNPLPSKSLFECVRLLSSYGLSLKELKIIMIDNPKRALGL